MRFRLAMSILMGTLVLALAFAAQALADPPVPAGPGPDAAFTTGVPIQFSATSTPDPLRTAPAANLKFYISKDSTVDPSQTTHYTVFSGPADAEGIYSGSADPAFLSKPGDYFWQPVDPECGLVTTDCFGPVRSFSILPLPAAAVTSSYQVETFLGKRPRHRTRKRKVKFSFSSNVTGATFECLFAKGWAKCRSPHVFRHLRRGRYKFEVRAVVNGIEDPDPQTWYFRVLRHRHHHRLH